MVAPENLRSPLARARGLGSAHDGLHHWWAQRITAIALIPLSLWFAASIIGLVRLAGHGGYLDFTAWISRPLNATLLILFFAVGFHHAVLGVQVVLEDYVACSARRIASIIATKLVCYGIAAFAIVATMILCFRV